MADETIKALAVQVAMDSGSFQAGVKSLKSSMDVIDSEFKASISGVKNWGSSLDSLKENAQALGEKINVQKQIIQAYTEQLDKSKSALEQNSQKLIDNKAKVEAARSAYEQSSISVGKNADETKALKNELDKAEAALRSSEGLVRKNEQSVQGYTIQLNNAKGSLNKMDSELAENNAKMKASESSVSKLKSAFSQLAAQSQKTTSNISSHFGSLKSTIVGFATAAVAGLSLNSLIESTDSAEKTMAQMDAVLKSTGGAAGMTKQQLVDLAAAQAKVTTFSAGTTKQAENMLLTFTGISSKVFPDTVKAAEDMATAMHTDATSAAMTLGKALNDPAAGLTKLTKQGVTFTEQQKQQIIAMQKAGDTAGAQKIILAELSKEFGGSAKAAGSTVTGQMQIMQNSLKGAGTTAMGAIMPIVTNLLPSVVKGAQNLAAAITAHKEDIQRTLSTVGNVVKGIFDFVTTHGQLVKSVLVGIAAGFLAFKAVSTIVAVVTTAMKAWEVATKAVSVVQGILNVVMSANPIGLIIIAVAALVAGFILLWNNCKGFRDFWIGLWNGIVSIVQGVIDWVKTNWPSIVLFIVSPVAGIFNYFYQNSEGFRNFINNLLNQIKGFFAGLWTGIQNIFNGVGTWFSNVFTGAYNGVKNAFSSVGSFFSGIWSKIQGAFSAVGSWFGKIFKGAWGAITGAFSGVKGFFDGVWSGMTSGVKGAINFVLKGINAIIGGLDMIHIDVPKGVPVIGGTSFGINIPKIPYLESGGVLKKGQTGYLEGNGDEAVVPLSQNTGWIGELARKLSVSIQTVQNGVSSKLPKQEFSSESQLQPIVLKATIPVYLNEGGDFVGMVVKEINYRNRQRNLPAIG